MSGTDIALTVISVLGTISSILFAFLAFKRNDKKDTKEEDRISPIFYLLSERLMFSHERKSLYDLQICYSYC